MRDGVDHVAVPPHRVSRLHIGDGREHAHQERAEQDVGHGFRDRDGLSGPLVDCPAFVDRLRDSLLPHLLEPSTMVTVSDLGTEGPLAGASLHAREAAVEGIWSEYRR